MTRLGLLPLGALLLLATACGESEAQREARVMQEATPQRVRADGAILLTQQDREALGLTVAPAAEGELPDGIIRFGQVVVPSANEAVVIAPVTGRVRGAPLVQLGDGVRVGTPIAQLVPVLDAGERISIETQGAQRQGEIDAAEKDLVRAEAEAARARQLAPQVVSAATLQEAETVVGTARARLDALRAARAAQTRVDSAIVTIRAPLAGRIVALSADAGASVKSGDVLARVLRPGPLWVDMSVPPDESPGERFEIVIQTGTVTAHLLSRGGVTQADGTRRDRLVVDAADATGLVPGAAVSVRVGRGATRGILLPDAAVVPGVDTDVVYVETEPGVFMPRPVRVAARFGRQVRVSTGLRAGDRVVTQGGMALRGEAVRAQLQPAG